MTTAKTPRPVAPATIATNRVGPAVATKSPNPIVSIDVAEK